MNQRTNGVLRVHALPGLKRMHVLDPALVRPPAPQMVPAHCQTVVWIDRAKAVRMNMQASYVQPGCIDSASCRLLLPRRNATRAWNCAASRV